MLAACMCNSWQCHMLCRSRTVKCWPASTAHPGCTSATAWPHAQRSPLHHARAARQQPHCICRRRRCSRAGACRPGCWLRAAMTWAGAASGPRFSNLPPDHERDFGEAPCKPQCPCRSAEWYDPSKDAWSAAEPLPESVSFAAYTGVQASTDPHVHKGHVWMLQAVQHNA